jgi:glycerol-3-phosphate acyltransferase PlsY
VAEQLPLLVFAIVIPLAIIYKHRANIARLRAGTENPLTRSAGATADQPSRS